jgi:hypothetical protein
MALITAFYRPVTVVLFCFERGMRFLLEAIDHKRLFADGVRQNRALSPVSSLLAG